MLLFKQFLIETKMKKLSSDFFGHKNPLRKDWLEILSKIRDNEQIGEIIRWAINIPMNSKKIDLYVWIGSISHEQLSNFLIGAETEDDGYYSFDGYIGAFDDYWNAENQNPNEAYIYIEDLGEVDSKDRKIIQHKLGKLFRVKGIK